MYNRRVIDTSYMFGNRISNCNDTDFPNQQHQQQQHEQQKQSISDKFTTSPKEAVIRIMGRDYPLTLTTYKRLVIGICIGWDSCRVEIAIVDNKFNELCLPMSTWKLLLQQEAEILQSFHNDTTPSH